MQASITKTPTVTLSISAYNEEKNILSFLRSVLDQVEVGFVLQKILIISDGSTDKTVEIVRSLNHPKIEIRGHTERLGKSARLNEIYADLSSDILVQSDADVIFDNPLVMRNLIRPFLINDRVGTVGGNPKPLPAQTFTERAVNLTAAAYVPLRSLVRGGNNVFSADGRLLAYRRDLVKKISIPENMIANDMFTYFCTLTQGLEYRHVPEAVVRYRSPQNLRDQIRQNTRFIASRRRMSRYFDPELVKKELAVPPGLLYKTLLSQFFRDPILAGYIFLVNRYCQIKSLIVEKKLNAKWDLAPSTKVLDKKHERQTRYFLFVFIFAAIILFLSLKGLPGNPTAAELNVPAWKDNGPLELSPDRGRFALLYSLVEEKSFVFSPEIARFATPDVGYHNGQYVSLFAPGLSFLLIPGYLAGKIFGVSQIGTFAIIALFAILNALLIAAITTRLGAHPAAATLGAVAFLFATPAFAYAVSLYQHHVSVFFILLSIYALLRWKESLWPLALVWFLAALSVVVDNPNFFLMLPIAIFALGRMIILRLDKDGLKAKLRLAGLFTFVTIVLPVFFFLWFNTQSYGNPLQLPGTVQAVQEIDEAGLPTGSKVAERLNLENRRVDTKEKTAIGFFKTRNLLNGFYTHFFSLDRGVIYYAPVVILGALGLYFLYKRNQKFTKLALAVLGVNILLYSMWGDPYGGWAFGSRYLIPAYALLGIGKALLLTRFRSNNLVILIFLSVFGYSVWVNTLGALTTNRNPPKIEVLALEAVSGREEKYTYERNLDMLNSDISKSFVFQSWANNYMSAKTYHLILTISIILGGFVLAGVLHNTNPATHSDEH